MSVPKTIYCYILYLIFPLILQVNLKLNHKQINKKIYIEKSLHQPN